MKFSLETRREVWNDESGDRIDVGEDRDGLGLVELRSIDKGGRIENSLAMPPDQARLVAEAILLACDELEAKEKE